MQWSSSNTVIKAKCAGCPQDFLLEDLSFCCREFDRKEVMKVTQVLGMITSYEFVPN